MPKRKKIEKSNNPTSKDITSKTNNLNKKTISLPNKNSNKINQKFKNQNQKTKFYEIKYKNFFKTQNPKIKNSFQSSIIEFNPQIYKFYINNPSLNVNELKYKNNTINTRKYNIITFLPKSLLFQFMRFANVYFLIIAIIQCIPIISPLGAFSAIIPLIFVLTVSLIREGYEDLQRAKIDKEQNCEICEVYKNGKWVKIKSGDLKMGEIISVKKDSTFPADLVLLDSDLPNGICYIETGTLDGEKNLKLKASPNFTQGKFNLNKNDKIQNFIENENNMIESFNNSHNYINNTNNLNVINEINRKNEGKIIKEKKNDFQIKGTCQCDLPNPNLYQLNGKIKLKLNNEECSFPLEAKNLLLKGAKLRNTNWIIGIIIYTGHNCKLLKNSKEPLGKFSSIEKLMNKLLIAILLFQIFLSFLCSIFHSIYFNQHYDLIIQQRYIKTKEERERITYIDFLYFNIKIDSFLSFFTYLLLLNTMIPISLIVTLEIVKVIQGIFIGIDIEGYSKIRHKFITPNSVSLNEECGSVNYIFTDKTGTLTCNKMSMKFCVIGDICYEIIKNDYDKNKEFRKKEIITTIQDYDMYKASIQKNKNKVLDIIIYNNYLAKSNDDSNITLKLDRTDKLIKEFWTALAICHDCTIQGGKYIGMSPDNIELVKTAKFQGFSYEISELNNKIILFLGEKNNKIKKVYNKVCQIEFSSERKRESVIIKDGNIYKLYIKGADNIIEERLNESTPKEILNKAKYYVNLFSSKGYRTLFVAMRILSEKEYENFSIELNKAKMDTEKKNEKISLCYQMVESNLTLIGATIVEDKLQENVPEVIKDLRLSGIKIWMLTGDKLSTAYNIGLSCNLISKDMKVFKIEGKKMVKNEHLEDINKEERIQTIVKFIKEFSHYKGYLNSMDKKTNLNFSILIDENALFTINESEEISKMFLNVAKDAITVICCRVSPLQKSQVIKMMKNYDKSKITLAIGDGGNDVSMIMESHIGIGIYGEEGLRAAQSSDYAIGEFQILRRLLFFHGNLNLMRNSEMIIYFFYKNFVFTIIHFFYGYLNDFSGQTIIDDWFITCFNLIFTSIPLAVKGIIDIDLSPVDGKVVYLLQPYLYFEGREYPKFTIFNFILELIKGVFHSFINYYICINGSKSVINSLGHVKCLWYNSVILYTNIIIIVSIDLIVITKYHTWINWVLLFFCTFFLYIVFLIAVHKLIMFNSQGTMQIAFSSYRSWLFFILIGGISFISELAILAFKTLFINNVRNCIKLMKNKDDISEIEKKLNFISEDDNSNNKNDSNSNDDENDISNIKKNNDNFKGESTDNILQATNTVRSASLNMKKKNFNDDNLFLPEKEEKEKKKDKKENNKNFQGNFSIVESISQDEMTSKNEEELKNI